MSNPIYASELNEQAKLRASIGIPTLAKLAAWARMVHSRPSSDGK